MQLKAGSIYDDSDLPEPTAPPDPPGYTSLGGGRRYILPKEKPPVSIYTMGDDSPLPEWVWLMRRWHKLGMRGRWLLQVIALSGLLYAVFSALGM